MFHTIINLEKSFRSNINMAKVIGIDLGYNQLLCIHL